jgi:hypothetical protein
MFRWFARAAKGNLPCYDERLMDQNQCGLVPKEDGPTFATFLKTGDGFLYLRLPNIEGGCLLAFSTPMRAADYASVQEPNQTFEYFCSSAEQVVFGVKQFREHLGVNHIALDRCPRCNLCVAIESSSLDSAARVIQLWKDRNVQEFARSSLYWDYARTAAKNGQFLRARDVALELVGHVSQEDPRSHLLLGKLAIQLRDKQLIREAKAFLAFSKADREVEELHAAEKTGVLDF